MYKYLLGLVILGLPSVHWLNADTRGCLDEHHCSYFGYVDQSGCEGSLSEWCDYYGHIPEFVKNPLIEIEDKELRKAVLTDTAELEGCEECVLIEPDMMGYGGPTKGRSQLKLPKRNIEKLNHRYLEGRPEEFSETTLTVFGLIAMLDVASGMKDRKELCFLVVDIVVASMLLQQDVQENGANHELAESVSRIATSFISEGTKCEY